MSVSRSLPAELTPGLESANHGPRMTPVPCALLFTHSGAETSGAVLDVLARLGARRPLLVLGEKSPGLVGRSLLIDCSSRVDCAAARVDRASLGAVAGLGRAIAAGRHDAVI